MSNKIALISALLKPEATKGKHLIFRSSIRLKDGSVIYASNYGLRGFPI